MTIRVKRATSVAELRRLINAVSPDDPDLRVLVDKEATAAEDPQYTVIWLEGDVTE